MHLQLYFQGLVNTFSNSFLSKFPALNPLSNHGISNPHHSRLR